MEMCGKKLKKWGNFTTFGKTHFSGLVSGKFWKKWVSTWAADLGLQLCRRYHVYPAARCYAVCARIWRDYCSVPHSFFAFFSWACGVTIYSKKSEPHVSCGSFSFSGRGRGLMSIYDFTALFWAACRTFRAAHFREPHEMYVHGLMVLEKKI